MTLTINYNGDHLGPSWGENQQSVEAFFDRLNAYALDPRFEEYGDFCSGDLGDDIGPEWRGIVRVSGNFFDFSAAFSFDGTPEEIRPILDAIRAHQQTTRYKEARDETKEERKRERARREARDRNRRARWIA